MIELLSGWLKQIVILVMIAAFIDLLLPNNAMERYVKLVMGLLIILAILSPIFQLLREDLDLSRLAFNEQGTDGEKMTSLSTIRQQSKGIQQTQDRLIQKEAEERLAETVKKEVEKEFTAKVVRVQVKTRSDNEKGTAEVAGINLTVQPETKEEQQGSTSTVEEVAPVIIDGSQSTGEESRSERRSSRQADWAKRITRFLQDSFALSANQIEVKVLEGDQGR